MPIGPAVLAVLSPPSYLRVVRHCLELSFVRVILAPSVLWSECCAFAHSPGSHCVIVMVQALILDRYGCMSAVKIEVKPETSTRDASAAPGDATRAERSMNFHSIEMESPLSTISKWASDRAATAQAAAAKYRKHLSDCCLLSLVFHAQIHFAGYRRLSLPIGSLLMGSACVANKFCCDFECYRSQRSNRMAKSMLDGVHGRRRPNTKGFVQIFSPRETLDANYTGCSS